MYSLDGRIIPTINGFKKFNNGGKGSGNFGHSGRPGYVGGSSKSATTTARLARGDKVADAERKARELQIELTETPYSSMTESEYKSKSAEIAEAGKKARELDVENRRLSREEIERGMAKKRNQDTPGKKETLKALDEAKKAIDKYREAYDKTKEFDYNTEEYERARGKADAASKEFAVAREKLESAITSQMVKDKQFNDDLKQHIEDGLGIKLKDLKLAVKDYKTKRSEWKSVGGVAKLSNNDLGAFGKVLRSAQIEVNTSMNTDSSSEDFGTMWGSADLRYASRSGGENGQNLFRINYYPDGSYVISDNRGGL